MDREEPISDTIGEQGVTIFKSCDFSKIKKNSIIEEDVQKDTAYSF